MKQRNTPPPPTTTTTTTASITPKKNNNKTSHFFLPTSYAPCWKHCQHKNLTKSYFKITVFLFCFFFSLLSCPDIRQQLSDQLKCLEIKLDTEVAVVTELQEFFRRRAEVEQDYAQKLDKLVKTMITRHKTEK